MDVPQKIGKYRIIERLGQGASGCVLKAEQEVICRIVAMKVLFIHLLQAKPASMRRFKREARLAASLVHPNIVPIFEIGEADGMHYYTMQYIAGMPMTKYIQNDSISLIEKVNTCIELSDALGLAHRRNIIHRDLKPHNVIITKDLHPVILDFGIAKSLIEEDEQVTQAGHILGSAHYMAPEQAGPGEVGTYTDVFGLGVMMYEMMTGKRPFEGSNVTELIYQRIQYRQNPEEMRPRSMPELNPAIPKALDDIVFRCIEAAPEDRYPSANEVLLDLQKLRRELFFDQTLKGEEKRRDKVALPVDKKRSYLYPSVLSLTIFGLLFVLGLWVYKGEGIRAFAAPFSRLKAIQIEGSKVVQEYAKTLRAFLGSK